MNFLRRTPQYIFLYYTSNALSDYLSWITWVNRGPSITEYLPYLPRESIQGLEWSRARAEKWKSGAGFALSSMAEGLPSNRKQKRRLPTIESIEDGRATSWIKHTSQKRSHRRRARRRGQRSVQQRVISLLCYYLSVLLPESDRIFSCINLQSSEIPIPFTSRGYVTLSEDGP